MRARHQGEAETLSPWQVKLCPGKCVCVCVATMQNRLRCSSVSKGCFASRWLHTFLWKGSGIISSEFPFGGLRCLCWTFREPCSPVGFWKAGGSRCASARLARVNSYQICQLQRVSHVHQRFFDPDAFPTSDAHQGFRRTGLLPFFSCS